jgi:hypothetical protein
MFIKAYYGSNFDTVTSRAVWGILLDWLWRGYAFEALWPTASNPNVYLAVGSSTTAFSELTNVPRLAVARSTSEWNAPAQYSTSTYKRKITNINTLTFSPATGSGTASMVGVFKDAVDGADSSLIFWMKLRAATAYVAGDELQFAPGELEFRIG